MDLSFQSGDIFLTANPMALGKAINSIQRFWDKSSHSIYSHAGLIIDNVGTTFEALWHVESQNIVTAYAQTRVFIARHSAMTARSFSKAYSVVSQQEGNFYPFYRLIFHMFPPLAKLSMGRMVCSELVARFLYEINLIGFYNGCNPDDLHNHICWARGWEIIFEGVMWKG